MQLTNRYFFLFEEICLLIKYNFLIIDDLVNLTVVLQIHVYAYLIGRFLGSVAIQCDYTK